MTRKGIHGRLGAALALSLVAGGVRAQADDVNTAYYMVSKQNEEVPKPPAQQPQPPQQQPEIPDFEHTCPPRVNCTCSSCCESQGSWVGGVDMLFLGSSTRGASASTTIDGVTKSADGFNQFTFDPRLWVGYQGDCWGVYGRFFHLSDSKQSFSPLNGGSSAASTSSDSLTAYYVDLELVREFGCDDTPIYASFGVRYGGMQSNCNVWSASVTNSFLTTASAGTERGFYGTGITAGLWGKAPVDGCCNLSYFWGVRGSVLWGNASNAAQTSATATDGPDSAGAINAAIASGNADVFIGEATLGVQWDHELKCLPATAFVRVAAEYQAWCTGNDGFAAATSLAVIPAVTSGSGTARSNDFNLQLYGFSVGTGFMW